jgi:very-short-patch-repair endonuclease
LNYQALMHPKVSKAEISLFQALSMANLTSGMVTQKPIILRSTIPDFCWPEKRKIVYLDGNPVHNKDKAIQKDREIDELLELQGWDVLRIKYDPPLTQTSLQSIMSKIKQFLNVIDEEDIETQ